MGLFKTIGVVGSVAGVLLSASVAFAESDDRVITATTTRSVKVEAAREEAKARMETKREEAKQKIEAKREETKQKIETKREEAKNKMEAQREKAKQRLSDIRDKKKQEAAEKIAEQFEKLNEKWTDRFAEQLDKLGEILIKIQERSDIAASKGNDTSAVNAAIQSAQTAITAAQTAVTAQAAKTYVLNASAVTVTSATTTDKGQENLIKGLRTQFQAMHKALFKDLYALRDGVMKDARGAVQNALKTLSQIPKVDDDSNDN